MCAALDGGAHREEEILYYLLTNAFGGGMRDISRNLLNCFPSIFAMTKATVGELLSVEGVTEAIARYIKSVGAYVHNKYFVQSSISTNGEFIEFARSRLSGLSEEHVEFYFIGERKKIVMIKTCTDRDETKVCADVSEVLRALGENVSGLYVAHNHIGDDENPSEQDDLSTLRLLLACTSLGVTLYDHCIVAPSGIFSYKNSGRLGHLAEYIASKR